ncbi:MAG: FtsX-like permease family protein, partial [Bacteroidota bacterium]
ANYGALFTYENKDYVEPRTFLVDAEVFEIFDYELIQGDKKTALVEPFSVLLSESTARKIFGNENPMGKSLSYNNNDQVKVTGIFKDFPPNTHLTADVFVSMETGKSTFNQLVLNNWGEGSSYTYLLLPEGIGPEQIESKFPDFIEKNMGEGRSERVGIKLQKMTDIHLKSNLRGEIQANSDIRYIYISSAIALFIILIACINYMNLSTARSIKRALEIGVRKTLGAPRSLLIRQFLSESILLALFAFVLAYLLALLTLPAFNAFLGKDLSLNPLHNPDILGTFVLLTLGVGLLAGSYPAFYLSSFEAIRVFQESFTKGTSSILRRVLVVFQFSISILLILATIVVFNQWDFLKNKDLGINQENLVMVPIPDQSRYQALKTQLLDIPGVASVGASNKQLTNRLSSNLGFKAEQYEVDPNQRSSIKIVTTDHDFFKTLEVDFKEGRDFSRKFVSDDTSAFVLNEAAVEMIGWDKPLGKWFETSEFSNGAWVTRRGKIVGVIENYNHESLYNEVEPAAYYISNSWLNWMTLRLTGEDQMSTLDQVREKWTQYASEELYRFNFLDERINEMYRTEERFFTLFTFFSILAIFIASLGILGLSSFIAERRIKEIGVRKIFGASVFNLIYLLTKEFSLLVLVGFIVAAPIGYVLLSNWLDGFIYHINIGWLPFVLAGVLTLAIAGLTSGFQSMRAAISNPIDALRYE